MTKTAFIFPGQGGQFVGQGLDWVKARPELRELFQMADDLSGRPISRYAFDGPIEELNQTANLQPAILAVSLMAARLLSAEGYAPSFAAGHSLGEFGALVAAKVLTEEESLGLVAKRAAIMDEAAKSNPGSMAAILNIDPENLEAICELARAEGPVVLANFNSPGQTVISGSSRAVAAAARYASLKGGRTVPLPLSGAFHSPLMSEAALAFSEHLEPVAFREPIFPVYPNSLGEPVREAAKIKELLKTQITSPVRWTQIAESLLENQVSILAECWPKPYLGTLTKKCFPKQSPAKTVCPAPLA
jgi:[acyl-carrier-protein] S-malonyltransferase